MLDHGQLSSYTNTNSRAVPPGISKTGECKLIEIK